MAEAKKTPSIEKEYTIPLRRAFLKAPRYERTRKAIKEIKKFIARHMKIPERDLSKVKLDVYLNNELWFRGRKKPPAKIKIMAKKEGDNVFVTFLEIPKHVQYKKAKIERKHKKPEKKKEEKPKEEPKPEEKKDEKSEDKKPEEDKKDEKKQEEKKKDEKEKEQAVAQQRTQQFEQQAKAQKHLAKSKAPQIQRKALKK